MASASAVGVHDDLASGDAAIGLWPAQLETARRIDVILCVLVDESLRQHREHDVLDDLVAQVAVLDARRVLSGDQHRVNPLGLVVLVFNRHLAFAVRPQPGQLFRPAHPFELRRQLVSELNRHRHQLRRLAARVAEHQALVAGALLLVQALAFGDALRNIRTLPADGNQHGAIVVMEAQPGVIVADPADRIPHHLGDIHRGL